MNKNGCDPRDDDGRGIDWVRVASGLALAGAFAGAAYGVFRLRKAVARHAAATPTAPAPPTTNGNESPPFDQAGWIWVGACFLVIVIPCGVAGFDLTYNYFAGGNDADVAPRQLTDLILGLCGFGIALILSGLISCLVVSEYRAAKRRRH